MQKIQINLLQAKLLERSPTGCLDVFYFIHPHLSNNAEVLSLNNAFLSSYLDRFANSVFVLVVASSVKSSVPDLHCLHYRLGILEAEGAETYHWHFVSVVESVVRLSARNFRSLH